MAATIQQIVKPTKARGLDTSTREQIVGNQLLGDPSFDTDVANGDVGTYWNCNDTNNEGISISSGKAHWADNGTASRRRLKDNVSGPFSDVTARYRLTITISDYTDGNIRIVSGSYYGSWLSAAGTYVIDFSPQTGSGNLQIDGDADAHLSVSEVTIYKLESFGNNNHAQIYSGRALEFDGVSDRFDVTEKLGVSKFENGSAWTWAGWIYFNDISVFQMFVGKGGLTKPQLLVQSSKFSFRAASGSGTYYRFPNGTALKDKTWYRVVYVASANQTITLYVNGVQDGDPITTSTDVYTGDPTLFSTTEMYFTSWGEPYSTGSSYAYGLDGMMSDGQVWDAEWTADDVMYDYLNPEQLVLNRGGTSLTNSNLKLWYPMNDGHRGDQSYILDASNVRLSDNLLTNGDFATGDFTGWLTSGDVTINNGGARIRSTDGTNAYINGQGLLKMGSTYKLTYDVTAINSTSNKLQHEGGTTSVTLDGTVIGTELGTHTYYFNNNRSNGNFVIKRGGSGADVTIDNLILQEVNPKYNATTVFYGDEMVANGDSEVTDPTTITINGVALAALSSTVDDSTAQNNTSTGTKSIKVLCDGDTAWPGVRWVGGDEMSLIIGRTYYMECYVYGNTGGEIDRLQLKYRKNDSTTVEIGSTSTLGSWQKLSGTFTIPDDITDIQIIGYKSGSSVDIPNTEFFYIDDISLKEVGVASGWTDADQQLDIPQTALQAYNQLAYNEIYNAGNAPLTTGAYTPNFGTDNFCVSFAIFPTDLSSNIRFMAIRQGGGRLIFQLKGSNDNEVQIYLEDADGNTLGGAYQTVSMTDIITEGNWYHILLSVNRSNDSARMYINGVYQEIAYDISGLTGNINGGGNLEFYSFSGDTDCFVGAIDEVAFWKGTAFSEATAQELYNDGKVLDPRNHSLSSTLINYWKNEGLGLWQDKVGTAHVATNRMTETMLITAGADSSRDSQGFLMNRQRTTNSLNLTTPLGGHSQNNYGLVPTGSGASPGDNINFIGSAFSFTCWVKLAYANPDQTTIIFDRGDGTDGFLFKHSTGRLPVLTIEKDNTEVAVNTGTSNNGGLVSGGMTVGTWYFVSGTHEGLTTSADMKIYVGTADVEAVRINTNVNGVALDNSAQDLYLGSRFNKGLPFSGELDDLCFYDKELSQDEVLRNYNAGKRSHR